ncbi:MAG TPA: histidinol-phosphate transaminase [Synechococcales cyanobacterium M55_K2018_004]|nr:histidinol-phosphate transaminase [Synechococcales cyanobacterium M55_K2018_004]
MLSFLRSDLSRLVSYTPHPGGSSGPGDDAPQVIDRLDTNECPFDLPADLKQKLSWHWQQIIESNRYPDGSHQALKEAIAQYISESAGAPTPWLTTAHLSVSSGSDELIRSLLIATCLGGEGSILVADPTFSMYAITAKTLGIPVVTIGRSEANFAMDVQAAQAAIASTQTPPIRVVFVVHPNSPTANALTAAEIDWLRSLPESILVVIDEAYFEFSGQTLVNDLPQHPNWVILRTFSKAFRLAAHRVGYGIAHPELAATLEKVRLPYNLPSFSLAAAQLAMAHRNLLLQVIPQIVAEREKLYGAIAPHPALRVWKSDANFLFLRLQNPAHTLSEAAAEAALDHIFISLKQQGTLVRKTCGGLRITIGTPEENQRTWERLQKIRLPSIEKDSLN